MSTGVLAGLLAGLAVWLAGRPSASARIRPGPTLVLPGWARPRAGAPPLRTRLLGGVLAGVVLLASLPGWLGPALGPPVAVGVVVAAGRLEAAAARRTRTRRALAMPDTLALLAGVLEAGVPLRAALERATEFGDDPCTQDLRTVRSRLAAGVSESDAWLGLAEVPGWQDAARDVARAVGSGEGVAGVLRSHAEEMRRAAAEEAEKRARKVGVSSTMPLVCCHLPAFLLVGVVPIIAGTVLRAL